MSSEWDDGSDFRDGAGDFVVCMGDLGLSAGDFVMCMGDFGPSAGDYVVSMGDFDSNVGDFLTSMGDTRYSVTVQAKYAIHKDKK